MATQRGDDVILKIGNGGTPETFSILGGLLGTELTLSHPVLDTTSCGTGAWQSLASDAGKLSLRIQGTGRVTHSAAEILLRQTALGTQPRQYQLQFGNGDTVQGIFQLSRYHRSGMHRAEETYGFTLESAGTVIYTPA
jgi:predicted secreted protein